jgi:tRNA(fMet)-specific endonuclease VapC
MIDTNIAIHARDGDEAVLRKCEEHKGATVMSSLTLAELQRGIFKYAVNTAIRQARLKKILQYISVMSFDAAAAESYGQIIAQCGWIKGRDFDRMIAAHALSINAILVTNNDKDFRDIPGLQIENWAE